MVENSVNKVYYALVFSTPNNASSWGIFHIKNNQLIILSFFFQRVENIVEEKGENAD